jgi:uncharacterized protein (TIGR02466 family)
LEIALRGLFATPVAAIRLPDAEARNARLRAAILAHREAFPSIQSSNAGGWHSERDLLEWAGPDANEIVAIAKSAATRLTSDRDGQPVKPRWSAQAWANVNAPGDGNICHYHPGSFWSGTYYVDDGGCAADPSLGGAFEMLDPRGAAPAMYAPAFKFAGEDGRSAGSAESITPAAGLMVLFPSWLHHQVRLYRGSALRISIAFNLGL